jgi:hypothetical protein
MVESILPYAPLISAVIVSGVLTIALVNLSTMRKNLQRQSEQQMSSLKIQSEQQIYSRITEVRLRLENTDEFTKMAMESPIFVERFALVDRPAEYYTIISFLDLFEYVFHLAKIQTIDDVVWQRWKVFAETIMTIPKFKVVWEKTKYSHPDKEFRAFMDSL